MCYCPACKRLDAIIEHQNAVYMSLYGNREPITDAEYGAWMAECERQSPGQQSAIREAINSCTSRFIAATVW